MMRATASSDAVSVSIKKIRDIRSTYQSTDIGVVVLDDGKVRYLDSLPQSVATQCPAISTFIVYTLAPSDFTLSVPLTVLLAIIEKRLFLNGGRAVIVEESLGMRQSTGYDGRKSRTDTRSAPSERPRK
jgi:hypothetical protein